MLHLIAHTQSQIWEEKCSIEFVFVLWADNIDYLANGSLDKV